MYLIVGLGNPEPEYSFTRHNMGFDVINKLSKKYEIPVERQGFKSLYGIGEILNNKVILCKPQTFMNLSGNAIIEIANFYKIDLKEGSNAISYTNCIFYDNQNKTLPVGQDLSTKILVDISKLQLDLKNKTSFKMVEFENEKDDFSEINIKTVTVFEYDALIKKQEENKV